jgi:hypothetical protein
MVSRRSSCASLAFDDQVGGEVPRRHVDESRPNKTYRQDKYAPESDHEETEMRCEEAQLILPCEMQPGMDAQFGTENAGACATCTEDVEVDR